MKKWIKEKARALAIVLAVLLCRIKASYSVPLPGSDAGPPAKVREKIYIKNRCEQPLFISAKADNSEELDDSKADENSEKIEHSKSNKINPNSQKQKARASSSSKLLKEAKMVKDLNPDSQKLFKEFLKKKVSSINIDELPMSDFERNFLRGVLPRVLKEPDFAEHYLDSTLLWAKMHDASLIDVVKSFGASEEEYFSYIKNINKNTDITIKDSELSDTNSEEHLKSYETSESESWESETSE